jgi:hypothetical protein
MAYHPTPPSGRPPQGLRHHAPSHLCQPAWLRGHCRDLGPLTWASGLARALVGGQHKAAAEEIGVRAAVPGGQAQGLPHTAGLGSLELVGQPFGGIRTEIPSVARLAKGQPDCS